MHAWIGDCGSVVSEQTWPEAPKPVVAAAADDDMDLFGDDPNAEEAAKKLATEKAASRHIEVGKSNVVFEVKPSGSSVVLEEVAVKVDRAGGTRVGGGFQEGPDWVWDS